jgi:hypothetical protein
MELLTGTLPTVWIPRAELRDLRGLMRTRLALRSCSTQVKNRVSAALNRYGLKKPDEDGDLFTGRGRVHLNSHIQSLPEETREALDVSLVTKMKMKGQPLSHHYHPSLAARGRNRCFSGGEPQASYATFAGTDGGVAAIDRTLRYKVARLLP